jgi:hypothetical protein
MEQFEHAAQPLPQLLPPIVQKGASSAAGFTF